MKKVREIMTRDVQSCSPKTAIAQVAQMMRQLDVGSIPLVENDRLVGIITDRDIVLRVVADGLDPHIETADMHMTPGPVTAAPDWSVDQAREVMAREQIRRLPVAEDGRLVGYLALGDLATLDQDRRTGEALERISEPGQPEGTARETGR